jgi:hypothetical protein
MQQKSDDKARKMSRITSQAAPKNILLQIQTI